MRSKPSVFMATSESGFGGGERIFLDLFEFLQKEGHLVSCYVPKGSALGKIIDSSNLVSQLRDIPDLSDQIVIANDFHILYKMTLRRRKKTIFICHGPWQLTEKMKIYLKMARIDVFFVSTYVMSFSKKGVSLKSNRIHSLMYKPGERFFIKHSASERILAREFLQLPLDQIIVCTHSRYHSSKKLEIFLEVVLEAGMVPLLSMVGGARTSDETELEEKLKSRFNGNQVFLYSDVDPIKLFLASDIYLSTSELETLGVSLMEACAFGLPIVTSAKGGPHDFLFDGINCFKVDNDIDRIKNQLTAIIRQVDPPIPMRTYYNGNLAEFEKFSSLIGMIHD